MRSAVLFTCCCLAAIGANAQTTGTIDGVVTDPAGSVVQHAGITLREIETQAVRQLTSGSNGYYLASGLAAGSYDIRVEAAGFRVSERRGVNLAAGRSLRVDVALALGKHSETVVVEGAAPLTSPNIGDWGTAVGQERMAELPLDGRDVFELAAREPGAAVSYTSQRSAFYGEATHMSIDGARPGDNTYLIDGIFANDATGAAPASASGQTLGVEAVAELRLVSSPFLAEYGRAGGGMFIAVSRSGSNQLHGSAFEFLRNSALDAKNFFDSPTSHIPPLKRNQFGGLVSGPIVRNRLFFLFDYEGVLNSTATTSIATTIDAAARQGILPGGDVTPSAAAAPFVKLYPLPNGILFGDGTGQFIAQLPTRGHENYGTGKVDYIRSDRLRFGARYSLDGGVSSTPDPFLLWNFLSQSASNFAQVNAQYVPSSTTVYELRAGFSRVDNSYSASQTSSIPSGLTFAPGEGLGAMVVNGLTDFGGQTLRSLPLRYLTNDYQESGDVSHVAGRHSFKAGAGFERLQFNPVVGQDPLGYYDFTSLASLISGTPASGQIQLPGATLERGWRQNLFFVYAQDEFQLFARLRVSLGVRYEPYSTPVEVNGLVAALPDPFHDTTATLGIGPFRNPSKTNFGPRAAVAWDIFGHGQTVFRAGSGIFYDMISSEDMTFSGSKMVPFFNRASLTAPPFPDLAAAAKAPALPTTEAMQYYESQPYVIQMQAAVEQLAGRHWLFRVGYAGSHGVHLQGYAGDVNVPVPSYLPDGQIYFSPTAPLLNPNFARIGDRLTQFPSTSNALQLHAGQSFSHGLRWQANYSFTKVIDESSNPNENELLNDDFMPFPLDFRENRGPASFDIAQVFSADGSWEFKTNRLLGNWQIESIFQAQSGPFFNPIIGFDRAGLRDNISQTIGQRPSLVTGVPVILGNPAEWYNPLAFTLPAAGTYGNLGRNTLLGPGLVNLNFAVHKTLWSRETTRVTLRGEIFNLANHPNFQIPSGLNLFASTGTRIASAGEITQTTTPSRQVQLALKVTF